MKTLDHTQKQGVAYCIPLWLRDQQIRYSVSRIKERLQKGEERSDPVAIACFGPSLRDTWEQIRDFKYVISCSGSHKFLVERGIIPTWHVEVDPRPHKVELLGPPQKETTYLISSTCHPKVFDHLEGFPVRLWHVFDATEEGVRLLPQGEFALTGGCDVGLRAVTIASFLGFRDLHVFGMDHSAGTEDAPMPLRHAAEHPNGKPKSFDVCEYNGVKYLTTSGMLEAARTVWHELDMLPPLKTTFYGEGLCQAMRRDYVRKEETGPLVGVVAVEKPELISAGYRDLNFQLHQQSLHYGAGGEKHAPVIMKLAAAMKTKNILDYGCGKGSLARAIPWQIAEYDPCIPGKDESPKAADLVVCTDVLEHIEPEHIVNVLSDLRRCVSQVGYFVIHTGPSTKSLPDGRNAHVLQRPPKWWTKILGKFFTIGRVWEVKPLLFVVVGVKKKEKKAA